MTATPNPIEPLLHTIPGAQARVPVGRSTLYELIKSGQIRAVKIGRRTYIADDELKRYVASLDHGAGTDPATGEILDTPKG